MKTHQRSWKLAVIFTSALFGTTALTSYAERPDMPTASNSPAQTANIDDATAQSGHRTPGLLQELLPPRLTMWDRRQLDEIKRQARAAFGANRTGGNQLNTGRAQYGTVAPLVLDATANPADDDAALYRVELDRLDVLVQLGRASTNDYFLRGLIRYDLGQWKLASQDFDMAVRSSVKPSHEFFSMRGLAQYQMMQFRPAWLDLNEAVRLSADVNNLNNRGVLAAALGQSQAALADFDSALAIRQWIINTSSVDINKALVLSDLGQHDKALKLLKSVIETSSDVHAFDPANLAAGVVYDRSGDFRKSGLSYDIVIERHRADNHQQVGPMIARAFVGRAIAHHKLNQIYPALDDYTKAVEAYRDDPIAFVNRAVAWQELDRVGFALTDLDTALELDSNDVFALANRGLLRMKMGEVELGKADYARCIEIAPGLKPTIEGLMTLDQSTPSATNRRRSPWDTSANDHRSSNTGNDRSSGSSILTINLNSPTESSSEKSVASTPEEAVQLLLAAMQKQDWDQAMELLADPLGELLRETRTAAKQLDRSMQNFRAAKNARSGSFVDLSRLPIAPQADVGSAEQLTMMQMTVASKTFIPGGGGTARVVVETVYESSRHGRQTVLNAYVAVPTGASWKLMPEMYWSTFRDPEQVKLIIDGASAKIAGFNRLREKIDAAALALKEGKPVEEYDLLVAWKETIEFQPWPGANGSDTDSFANLLARSSLQIMIQQQLPAPAPAPQ